MKTVTFVVSINVIVPDEVNVEKLDFNHLISDKVEVILHHGEEGEEILDDAQVMEYSIDDVIDDVATEEDLLDFAEEEEEAVE